MTSSPGGGACAASAAPASAAPSAFAASAFAASAFAASAFAAATLTLLHFSSSKPGAHCSKQSSQPCVKIREVLPR
jgi:hypothetical protein